MAPPTAAGALFPALSTGRDPYPRSDQRRYVRLVRLSRDLSGHNASLHDPMNGNGMFSEFELSGLFADGTQHHSCSVAGAV